jgi:hypothetical protein
MTVLHIAPANLPGARSSGSAVSSSPAITVGAAATVVVLATQADGEMLDYSVGVVPALVPWLAAGLAVAVAAVALSGRGTSAAAMSLLMGALAIMTAWSLAMLPFDALRIVGLVPLPLSGWGLGLRLLLLIAGASAIGAAGPARRAVPRAGASCREAKPRAWPALVAVVFAPYPSAGRPGTNDVRHGRRTHGSRACRRQGGHRRIVPGGLHRLPAGRRA